MNMVTDKQDWHIKVLSPFQFPNVIPDFFSPYQLKNPQIVKQ